MRSPTRPEIVVDIAQLVRATRIDLRLSQRALSSRSGISQSRISRLESLAIVDISLSEVDALMRALGIRYWLGRDTPRVIKTSRDEVHGWCSAYVARRLIVDGWLVEREVEIGGDRWKGWIDLLAFHPASGGLLIIEVKTEIVDIGEIERTLNWYQREAPTAARRFGWAAVSTHCALLVLHTATNDRLLASNGQVLSLAFAGRASQLQALIRVGRREGSGRSVALIDPHSRRTAWLRPTRSEGRRTAAPYADYIDAARQLDQKRRTTRNA